MQVKMMKVKKRPEQTHHKGKKYIEYVNQSRHNCLLGRLHRKLTHDMVKRCSKKLNSKKKNSVVPELADRHRLTLRRVFIGPKHSVFPHYGVPTKQNLKKS